MCERVLVLYGELLRLCRLPIYDPGRIIRISPSAGSDPASATLDVVVPVVDHLPQAFFYQIYSDAVALLYATMLDEPDEQSVAHLHNVIQAQVLDGLAKASPFLPVCLELCAFAHRANIPFRHHGGGAIKFGWGARSQAYLKASLQADSAVGGALAYDKQLTARYLRSAGFPVPEHSLVATPEAAIEAAAKHGWHVVVKPADRERSRGVTLDVTSEEKVLVAYERARAETSRVLVEKHLPGVCHRIMVAGGEVVFAVKRNPKGVIGDGMRSVRELIVDAQAAEAGLPPWKRSGATPLDELALKCLGRAGLSIDCVPSPGQYAPLRPFVSAAYGGTVIDVREQVHPRNAQLAIDAAETLGLAFAGVDFITTDIARPWDETGGAINEVNFKPEFATLARTLETRGLLSIMAGDGGRIPVHLVTGAGDLRGDAQSILARLRDQGGGCHMASASDCEDGGGRPLILAAPSLFERSIALLMRNDVKALLLLDEAQEFLRLGFPVDRFDGVWVLHADRKVREAMRERIEARVPVSRVRTGIPSALATAAESAHGIASQRQ